MICKSFSYLRVPENLPAGWSVPSSLELENIANSSAVVTVAILAGSLGKIVTTGAPGVDTSISWT